MKTKTFFPILVFSLSPVNATGAPSQETSVDMLAAAYFLEDKEVEYKLLSEDDIERNVKGRIYSNNGKLIEEIPEDYIEDDSLWSLCAYVITYPNKNRYVEEKIMEFFVSAEVKWAYECLGGLLSKIVYIIENHKDVNIPFDPVKADERRFNNEAPWFVPEIVFSESYTFKIDWETLSHKKENNTNNVDEKSKGSGK